MAGRFSFFNPGIFFLIDTTSLLNLGWNLPTEAVEIFAMSTAVFNYKYYSIKYIDIESIVNYVNNNKISLVEIT